jgi:hypothetical protein
LILGEKGERGNQHAQLILPARDALFLEKKRKNKTKNESKHNASAETTVVALIFHFYRLLQPFSTHPMMTVSKCIYTVGRWVG